MNSLDTNILLRFLLDDLPAHSGRSEKAIRGATCYVSDVIVTEVVFVLEKVQKFSRIDVSQLVQKLTSLDSVICNKTIVHKALRLYERKAKLSFPDCFVAVEAEMSGDTLLTFDLELIKHGGSHVREP
jgi:predicted nucleic-acid-binding protein